MENNILRIGEEYLIYDENSGDPRSIRAFYLGKKIIYDQKSIAEFYFRKKEIKTNWLKNAKSLEGHLFARLNGKYPDIHASGIFKDEELDYYPYLYKEDGSERLTGFRVREIKDNLSKLEKDYLTERLKAYELKKKEVVA